MLNRRQFGRSLAAASLLASLNAASRVSAAIPSGVGFLGKILWLVVLVLS